MTLRAWGGKSCNNHTINQLVKWGKIGNPFDKCVIVFLRFPCFSFSNVLISSLNIFVFWPDGQTNQAIWRHHLDFKKLYGHFSQFDDHSFHFTDQRIHQLIQRIISRALWYRIGQGWYYITSKPLVRFRLWAFVAIHFPSFLSAVE